MKIMSMKIPQKPNQFDRIHPKYTDEEYLDGGQVYGDIDTNEVNKGFETIAQFKRDITGLEVPELDTKISQIKGALEYINNSIKVQKFTRREHEVDAILVKSCHTKEMLGEMLKASEEERDKKLEEIIFEVENIEIIKKYENSWQNSERVDTDSFQNYENIISRKFPGCNLFVDSYISNDDILFIEKIQRNIKQGVRIFL
ncbi:MAG TPA: hypothetical protein VJ455_01490 [Ignavibacteria bacterium]|nr:hypothetical protein [Ignavibacteria bacterium]